MATAKMTLLDIVQSALRSIGSDQVNSISDTPEATDVAYMVRDVFFDIIHSRYWPHLTKVVNPTASGNTALPTVMTIQDNVQRIYEDTLYYNKITASETDPRFELVHYLTLEEFLRHTMQRSSSASETYVQEVSTSSSLKYYVYNDRAPMYFTSIDDETLLFDAFDSGVDSTLQSVKTQVAIYEEPTFTLLNSWEADLPNKIFPYFLSEVKSVVSLEIAQEANPKQEQVSRDHRDWFAREKHRTTKGIKYADRTHFGRK